MTIKEVRQRIFARDNYKCYVCGVGELLCLDHLIPKSLVPIHTVGNIMTLCWRCNFRKGRHNLEMEEYMIREDYIINANKAFSVSEMEEINRVLHEYFTIGGGVKKATRKPRRNANDIYLEYMASKK